MGVTTGYEEERLGDTRESMIIAACLYLLLLLVFW